MMKRTWGSAKVALLAGSAAVMFGLTILVMSLLAAANPLAVLPKEPTTPPEATPTIAIMPTATPSAVSNYYLPYPGILPDSPLYKIKAIRDRVMLWVTTDEEAKVKLELLYADKRINAALALTEGGKITLGVSTATKAEKYLESAVTGAIELSKAGKDEKSMLATLEKAINKHEEVMGRIIEKTTGNEQQVAQVTLKNTQLLGEKISQTLLEAK